MGGGKKYLKFDPSTQYQYIFLFLELSAQQLTGFLDDALLGLLTNTAAQSPYLHTGYLCPIKVRDQIFDVK